MDDEPVKFTKNKRLVEKQGDGSHVGGRLGEDSDILEFPKLNKRGMSIFD